METARLLERISELEAALDEALKERDGALKAWQDAAEEIERWKGCQLSVEQLQEIERFIENPPPLTPAMIELMRQWKG